MAKRVVVSGAQQAAARGIVKRDAASGKTTRGSVKAIANAKSAYRSTLAQPLVATNTSEGRS